MLKRLGIAFLLLSNPIGHAILICLFVAWIFSFFLPPEPQPVVIHHSPVFVLVGYEPSGKPRYRPQYEIEGTVA